MSVLPESQYLQSYDSLPDFLKPKFGEDCYMCQERSSYYTCQERSWVRAGPKRACITPSPAAAGLRSRHRLSLVLLRLPSSAAHLA